MQLASAPTPYYLMATVYGGAMLILGLLARRRIQDPRTYFVGGHRLGLVLSVGTFGATFLSAGGFLGNVAFGYVNGLVILAWLIIPVLLGLGVSVLLAPWYRQERYVTVPEYLLKRYGSPWFSAAVSILLFIIFVVSVAAQFIGLATVISGAFNLPYLVALLAAGGLVVVYTAAGGMVAVAVTDLVQFILLTLGLAYVTLHAVDLAGGFGGVMRAAAEISTAPASGLPPTPAGSLTHPTALGKWPLTMIFGYALGWLLGVAVNPKYLVRLQAAKDVRTAIRTVVWAIGILGPVYVLSAWLGVAIRVLLPSLPEGVRPDYVLIHFLQEFESPWLGALVVVALMAAIMSTIDSELLVASSALGYDLTRLLRPGASPSTILRTGKWASWLVGILGLIGAARPPSLLLYVQAYSYGLIAAALALPVLLGLFWRRVALRDCVWGVAVSLVLVVIVQGTGLFKNSIHPTAVAVLVGGLVTVVSTLGSRAQPGLSVPLRGN